MEQGMGFRPRFWRLWGYGLRGLTKRLRRQDALYRWRPARLGVKPWRGALAWWRHSLLNWHGVQVGWKQPGAIRVMAQVYHFGPLCLKLGLTESAADFIPPMESKARA